MTCFFNKSIIFISFASKFSFCIFFNWIIHKIRVFFIIFIIARFPLQCSCIIITFS